MSFILNILASCGLKVEFNTKARCKEARAKALAKKKKKKKKKKILFSPHHKKKKKKI